MQVAYIFRICGKLNFLCRRHKYNDIGESFDFSKPIDAFTIMPIWDVSIHLVLVTILRNFSNLYNYNEPIFFGFPDYILLVLECGE